MEGAALESNAGCETKLRIYLDDPWDELDPAGRQRTVPAQRVLHGPGQVVSLDTAVRGSLEITMLEQRRKIHAVLSFGLLAAFLCNSLENQFIDPRLRQVSSCHGDTK